MAAPSTPQNVREEFLQRAHEGQTITYKNIRQVIEEEKSKAISAPVLSEPPKSLTSIPEIVTIIPKQGVKTETPVIEVTVAKTTSVSPVVVNPYEIESGWFLLEKQHLLFCGDTASPQFIDRIPFATLAIAITSDDWDHDWLVERAKAVIIFPESDLKEQLIEQLIKMFSGSGDIVIFPWLPSADMVAIAHQLNRRVFAGDPSVERCRQAIAHSRLKSQPLNLP